LSEARRGAFSRQKKRALDVLFHGPTTQVAQRQSTLAPKAAQRISLGCEMQCGGMVNLKSGILNVQSGGK
jgi:hypothetical protein